MRAGHTGYDDTDSRHIGDLWRTDWTATDGTKGRGDVGSQFWVLCDWYYELENGRANSAGTDFDHAGLIIKQSPGTLSCFIDRT